MSDRAGPASAPAPRQEIPEAADYDLRGAIDVHVHSSPDVYPRLLDDFEVAREAMAAGMKALLLKSHHTLTADRAALVQKQTHLPCFGGVVLNQTVGGLNPVACETAIEFGARQIWMPTIHAGHCMDVADHPMFRAEARRGRTGIRAVANGLPTPQALAILEIVRDAGVILGTGHLAPAESLALLRAAHDMGLRRMLVTHPLMSFTRFHLDEMRAAVSFGAMLEFDFLSCSPRWPDAVSPAETARHMREIGPRHCVMGSDGGQASNPPAPQMLRQFAVALRASGIEPHELRTMLCDNPSSLLGL